MCAPSQVRAPDADAFVSGATRLRNVDGMIATLPQALVADVITLREIRFGSLLRGASGCRESTGIGLIITPSEPMPQSFSLATPTADDTRRRDEYAIARAWTGRNRGDAIETV